MKTIKLILGFITLSTVFASLVFPMQHAVAYDPYDDTLCNQAQSNSGGTEPPSACKASSDDPLTRSGGKEGIIFRAARLVAIATAVVSVVMIILGGFTYITSSGDPQKINGAKNTVLYAIIGLVVALFAQVILEFVLKKI